MQKHLSLSETDTVQYYIYGKLLLQDGQGLDVVIAHHRVRWILEFSAQRRQPHLTMRPTIELDFAD